MTRDAEELRPIEFFAATVEDTLGERLRRLGFTPDVLAPQRVTYRRDRSLVSLAFYPEDALPAPVTVSVGLREDEQDKVVALWRALPGLGQVAVASWEFHDRESLADLLRRFEVEVLAVAVEVASDEQRITRLVDEQAKEVEAQYQEDLRRSGLAQARSAFDAERYADSVSAYVLIGSDTLSAGDRRRLLLARRRAADRDQG